MKTIQVLAATLTIAVAFTLVSTNAMALKKGDTVSQTRVRDSHNKSAGIPDLGSKVMAVFYIDPDVQNKNKPFRDRLEKIKIDPSKLRNLAIINLNDTWLANGVVRSVVRSKEKKFNTPILTDPGHLLKKAWRLGNSNGKDFVIILDKDRKVRFIKADKMSDNEIKHVLELIHELVAR